MNDRNNTIAGWVLFAGIIALGASVVTGEMFHSGELEHPGYPVEGAEEGAEGGGEAEKPIAFYLASADAAKGEQVFKKCAACHNADPGGANALGPALHGVMGRAIAGAPGFSYSPALSGVGGNWDWDKMSAWLANPKKFAPGNKMTFAGLGKPEDRANLLMFLNSRGGKLTVPPPPAEGAVDAQAESDAAPKPGSGTGDGAQQAEGEPVLNEAQDAKSPKGGGEASPKAQ